MDSKQKLQLFLSDARECLQGIRKNLAVLQHDPENNDAYFEVMRLFHSLKSTSAYMGCQDMSRSCLEIETLFKEINTDKSRTFPALIEEAERLATDTERTLDDMERGENQAGVTVA